MSCISLAIGRGSGLSIDQYLSCVTYRLAVALFAWTLYSLATCVCFLFTSSLVQMSTVGSVVPLWFNSHLLGSAHCERLLPIAQSCAENSLEWEDFYLSAVRRICDGYSILQAELEVIRGEH